MLVRINKFGIGIAQRPNWDTNMLIYSNVPTG